jgi:membrane-bound lytic murein transglycosylase B
VCRTVAVLTIAALTTPGLLAQDADPTRSSFEEWLQGVKAEARTRGISEAVVARALDGLEPLPVVVERDRTQAEFVLALDHYLKRRVSAQTVRTGRRAFDRNRALLRRVQSRYGVDAATIVSIWGLESSFGRFSGVRPTVAALATLAYEPRRASLFREELFQALEIVDRGDIELAQLKGSWAGAMGQPQFLPSSFLRYAVDFNGDGRKDIWKSPPDVFGSIANYLKAHGWTDGQRWGRRVTVPADVAEAVAGVAPLRGTGCRAVRQLTEPRPMAEWRRVGVRLASGGRLPASDMNASLLQLDGMAFLVYGNYEALLGYNCANPYALSVATLADRIARR